MVTTRRQSQTTGKGSEENTDQAALSSPPATRSPPKKRAKKEVPQVDDVAEVTVDNPSSEVQNSSSVVISSPSAVDDSPDIKGSTSVTEVGSSATGNVSLPAEDTSSAVESKPEISQIAEPTAPEPGPIEKTNGEKAVVQSSSVKVKSERRSPKKSFADTSANGSATSTVTVPPVVIASPVKKQDPDRLKVEDDDDDMPVVPKRQQNVQSRSCPYLDTINRHVLDFDFEKLCSISLSHLNVYACLVCGKYFQGRGTSTYAYTHSVDSGHRVFMNLQTLRFYCLPDNYEIIDPSLEDIKYVLQPTFSLSHISGLNTNSKLSRANDNTTYYPGVVGLNNIKANDYCNVVLHALSQVPPLRNYFLREENYSNVVRPPGDKLVSLYQRFGELLRKLWNPRNFKRHVSPHEMLQAVVLCSEKRFQITKQGDAIDFLSWLLNTLHVSLNGTKKTNSSIIYQTFRGKIRSYTRKVLPTGADEEDRARLLLTEEYREVKEEVPFLYLTLDLPAAPLYCDELSKNVIPQVPLATLLAKFNGLTEKECKTYNENIVKRFEIVHLPRYLMMFVKRFTKNHFFVEKNPTIVNFPIKNVDLYEYLAADSKSKHKFTTYDLIANIVHDGKPGTTLSSYRIQMLHKGTGKWFELEDLHVKEILPQMITLTESYIQVWELNTTKTREQRKDESDEDEVDEELETRLKQAQKMAKMAQNLEKSDATHSHMEISV